MVSGWRSTAFSMRSSIGVLCTKPIPLWMSLGVEPGCAPHGGEASVKMSRVQLLTATAP